MKSSPRPWSVTTPALVVLTFGIVQLLGIIAWFRLPNLPFLIPKEYLLIRNLIWMGFSALTFVGIFLGKAWAPKATLGGGIIIFLWSVLDRLLLARSDYALKSILPSLIVYTLGLTAVLWLLNRPSAREYFEEKVHE